MIGLSIEQPPEGTNQELAIYLVRQLENIAASINSTNDFDGLHKYPAKYADGMLRYAYESDDFPSDGFYQVVKGKWEPVGSGDDCALSVSPYNSSCELDLTKANIVYGSVDSNYSFYGVADGKKFIIGLEYLHHPTIGIGVKIDQLILRDISNSGFFSEDGTLGYAKDGDGMPRLYLRNNGGWWKIDMTQVV